MLPKQLRYNKHGQLLPQLPSQRTQQTTQQTHQQTEQPQQQQAQGMGGQNVLLVLYPPGAHGAADTRPLGWDSQVS